MIGALWTGISGLSSQQKALDNESNNIANVNTIGYKASRISFADQMYQNKVGKGSTIQDAEKMYTQGNLKLTGVSYDMALSGDGFFVVKNDRLGGTAENLYTRAGNFRMGDNGTLQDASGNEVQGWSMSPIDMKSDVKSTNSNASLFTNDYDKLLSSRIVKYSSNVETITAKSTDYTETAKADSESIFSGDGLKSVSSKVSDIEEAISDYSSWLQKLSENPDGSSSSSVSQISYINFKTANGESLISKEGDQIYAYINGDKISQEYVSTIADQDLKIRLYRDAATRADYGLADPGTLGSPNTLTNREQEIYDKLGSRIETYKELSNNISSVTGLVSSIVEENSGSGINDVLESSDTFKNNTINPIEMLKGILEIKSLIPGKEFSISEVAEVSGNSTIQGSFLTTTNSVRGEGIGALASSRDALSKLISGNQRDVYTITDLNITSDGSVPQDFTYGINIFDKELNKNIPIPNNGGVPEQRLNIHINNATSIDDIVSAINNSTSPTFDPLGNSSTVSNNLSDYIVAKNINGNLVVETLDKNYDVEFTGSLKMSDNVRTDDGTANLTSNYNPIDKNNDYSGRKGAGAEFIEMVTNLNQSSSKDSLQLRLDTLGISDSAFGEFTVDETGLITMRQDGAEFAVGQVAIALFSNNRGLNPTGDNLLSRTNDSGQPIFNLNNDKTAKIESETLELSTADLSESLVNLMVFQRAFEANAKSITTADELLNTLINLKR